MGQVLHGSATTTESVRRAIQHSQESLRVLARRHGINPKTVAKWHRRTSATDLPTGPTVAKSTALSVDEEAMCAGSLVPQAAPSNASKPVIALVLPVAPGILVGDLD